MANLLESSATTSTTTPTFYTDYLSNLATSGTEAAKKAQFVGAQPLQEKAFSEVADKASAYQPTMEAAQNTVGQAVSSQSPLSAATSYFNTAGRSPAELAREYMDPYTSTVVANLGDAGARNIRMNLAPGATAAAVGAGQFGSKRGAEALGQTISNANRDILNQQASALNAAYQNALQAAGQQNQLQATMGKAAGDLASAGQVNLTNAGLAQGKLAETNQTLGLNDINALATLGEQQQKIKQNQQLFPLTTLSTLSGLMAGQTIPTTQKQTASASPLSLMATGASGLAGFLQPKYDRNGNPIAGSSSYDALSKAMSGGYDAVKDWYKNTFGNNASDIGSSRNTETGQTVDDYLYSNPSTTDTSSPTEQDVLDAMANDYGNGP